MEILHTDIHLLDLEARLPFKYGIVTMTRCPHCFVRVRLATEAGEFQGVAADVLPPKWFTKVPEKALEEETDEMLHVVGHAAQAARGLAGTTAYEIYLQLRSAQSDWGASQSHPPLLSQFGTSLFERALLEAACRSRGAAFADVVRADAFGMRLGDFDGRLRNLTPADLLPPPLTSVIARHTVGMVDPLTEADVGPDERVDDGLPQSLEACITAYGLTHYKLKVSADRDQDLDRLQQIAAVIAAVPTSEFAFSIDGNECFTSLDQFRDWWETISTDAGLRSFMPHLLFVEQPFHRDVALAAAAVGGLRSWDRRPPLIIDESDAEPGSAVQALELGYDGTSHKNCKGIFKSIANACLLQKLGRDGTRDRDGVGELLLSGEDLCNIGPVALPQDLAAAAAIGIESIERNGHHYIAGLSAFPAAVQEQALTAHPDLYRAAPAGWPTPAIAAGRMQIATAARAPFGVGFELDVDLFADIDEWRAARNSAEGPS